MTDERERTIIGIKTAMDDLVWRSLTLGSAALRAHDLSLQQALALQAAVRLGPGVDMTTLASASLLSPSTITSAVDRLVTRDLMHRYAHPRDRRRVMVDVTAAGVALQQEMEARDLAFWRWAMRDTNPERLEILRETVAQLLASLESMRPEDFLPGRTFPPQRGS